MTRDRVILPTRISDSHLAGLKDTFLQQRHMPLEVDAEAVCQIGALGLQFLISARRQWETDGVAFKVTGAGDSFKSTCAHLGVPLSELGLTDADGGV